MVDCNGLENRRTEGYRGFESLSLRHPIFIKSLIHTGLATFIIPVSPRILNFSGTLRGRKTLQFDYVL